MNEQEKFELALIGAFEQSHGKTQYEKIEKSSIFYSQLIDMIENSCQSNEAKATGFAMVGGRELHILK